MIKGQRLITVFITVFMSSVRWKDTPRVDFTDGAILASYHCIEEDNFDCKLASLRFRCEFY